jgi:putative restriction endonuclease
MKGYIGLTDPEWYAFLQKQPRLEEVNFWQPHGERVFRVLRRGELFFFKLRAPRKAIVGFGFFERYESMPAWMAWDAFEVMNGAPNYDSMLDRINRLRDESQGNLRREDFKIGCIMLSAPVLFPPEYWVDPPADWAKTGIQTGKSYDLGDGEGKRIYEDCLERVRLADLFWNIEPGVGRSEETVPRYGNPIEVRPRLGQGIFKIDVRIAYSGACAITREHSTPVLDAAHIMPYAKGGEHRVSNGVLLRRDLHSLFDHGYVTITPDYAFRVGERLRADFHNGRSYYHLQDTKINLPSDDTLWPKRELLEWHSQKIFKG